MNEEIDLSTTGITANLAGLRDSLKDALTRANEALDLVQSKNINGAMGALCGVDRSIEAAAALYAAAVALRRTSAGVKP